MAAMLWLLLLLPLWIVYCVAWPVDQRITIRWLFFVTFGTALLLTLAQPWRW
jgi:hypothetical protein